MAKIGLIAGRGRFPLLFAQSAKDRDLEVIAVGIRGETLPELEAQVAKMQWIALGEMEPLIRYFQSQGVKQAVMAGGVPKTEWVQNRVTLDPRLSKVIREAPDHGDQALLQAVAAELFRQGIQLLDSALFLEPFLAKEGVLGRHSPTASGWEDIRFAQGVARRLGELDIGQTVIVKAGTVLAVEALEGTDEAIRRAGRLGDAGAVVVKMARPRQDMRFDLPVVGLQTLDSLREAKASVLALEAGKTLILDDKLFLSGADEMGLAVVGIKA